MNLAVVSGFLTKDPEIKFAGEIAVLNFSLGVSVYKKGAENNRESIFLDFTAWDKKAELIADCFKKGDKVVVQTKIAQDKWTDDEGKNRSKVFFVVDEIELPKKNNGTNKSSPAPVDDDDFPF